MLPVVSPIVENAAAAPFCSWTVDSVPCRCKSCSQSASGELSAALVVLDAALDLLAVLDAALLEQAVDTEDIEQAEFVLGCLLASPTDWISAMRLRKVFLVHGKWIITLTKTNNTRLRMGIS